MCNSSYPAPASDQVIWTCQTLIEKNGASSSVTLGTAHLSEEQIHAHLSAADLIVFPYQTTQESASGAIRFALASRRPVVVTPLSIFDDVEELVQRLPGCTAEQMAVGLHGLLENPGLLRARQARQEEWLDAHAWRRISQRLWNMLRASSPLDLVSSDIAEISS
jgi:glycosyltransferase involved in cell wall biosynthesis